MWPRGKTLEIHEANIWHQCFKLSWFRCRAEFEWDTVFWLHCQLFGDTSEFFDHEMATTGGARCTQCSGPVAPLWSSGEPLLCADCIIAPAPPVTKIQTPMTQSQVVVYVPDSLRIHIVKITVPAETPPGVVDSTTTPPPGSSSQQQHQNTAAADSLDPETRF